MKGLVCFGGVAIHIVNSMEITVDFATRVRSDVKIDAAPAHGNRIFSFGVIRKTLDLEPLKFKKDKDKWFYGTL